MMPGNLCEHCTGMCCRYIALPIDVPEKPADFEDVRWYLLHENVSVFIEDGAWYISFHTPCRHLLPDQRCGIYETRPPICRKYTTDNCDYHSGDYGWEAHFTSPEHLDAWRAGQKNGAGRGGHGRARRTRSAHAAPAATTAPCDRQGVPLPILAPLPAARRGQRRPSRAG